MTAGRIPSRVSVNPKRVAGLGDDEVGHGAQPHPAPEGRAVDPGDHRHRAGVDRLEHVGHRHRVLLVALDVEAIAARIQAMSAPAQNDGPSPARTTARSSVGVFAGEQRERRPQLRDQAGIERVVDLRPGQRHARHDAAGSRPLDAQAAGRHRAHGRIVRQDPIVSRGRRR